MAWIGAAISVAGSLLSSSMQGDAAGDASGAQAEGTRLGVEEQRRQFDLNRRDLAPWRNTGAAAVNRLGVLMGLQPNANASPSARQSWQSLYDAALQRAPRIESEAAGQWVQDPLFGDVGAAPMVWRQGGTATTADANWARTEADRQFSAQNAATTSAAPDAGYGDLNRRFTLSDFWDDPVTQASYQFGLDEGRRALNNMAGARGNRNSGAQVRALTRFGTDYTGQRAGESYSRFYGDQDRTFNRLSGVAGTGQTAATNTAMLGQSSANNVSNLMSAQGNARGAAAIAGGNAMAGGIRNAANSIGNWWNQRNQQPTGYNPNASYWGQDLSQPDFSAGYY